MLFNDLLHGISEHLSRREIRLQNLSAVPISQEEAVAFEGENFMVLFLAFFQSPLIPDLLRNIVQDYSQLSLLNPEGGGVAGDHIGAVGGEEKSAGFPVEGDILEDLYDGGVLLYQRLNRLSLPMNKEGGEFIQHEPVDIQEAELNLPAWFFRLKFQEDASCIHTIEEGAEFMFAAADRGIELLSFPNLPGEKEVVGDSLPIYLPQFHLLGDLLSLRCGEGGFEGQGAEFY